MKTPLSSKNQRWNRPGKHFQIGLVLSLSLALLAFNFTSYYQIERVWPETDEEPVDITILEPIQTHKKKVVVEQPQPSEQGRLVVQEDAIPIPETEPTTPVNPEPPVFNPLTVDNLEEPDEGTLQANDIAEIVTWAPIMPEFPGGLVAMHEFIQENLVITPCVASIGVEGKIMVRFVVTPSGALTNIEVLRDVGCGMGDEAVKLVKKMPRWKPGGQGDRKVYVEMILPIVIKGD